MHWIANKFIFNENVHIYSPLDQKCYKRQATSYINEMSIITTLLVSSIKSKYLAQNELFQKWIARTYEYEDYYCQIPTVQMSWKLGYNPTFVRYFPENKDFHLQKIEEIYDKIIEAVKVVLPQEIINAKDEDYLVGLIILYDSYINIKFEFDPERTKKMIDLFFLSSGIKKKNLRTIIWEFCGLSISSPKKYDEYTNQLKVEDPMGFFWEYTISKIEDAKVNIAEEVEIRRNLRDQRYNNLLQVVNVILDSIAKHTMQNKHDVPILNLIERWIKLYKTDEIEIIKLSNFLSSRLLVMQGESRTKCMKLLNKVLDMRVKNIGLDDGTPFDKLKPELQEMDQIYLTLSTNGQEFVNGLIETIMTDLGIKEDNRIITSGSRTKTTIKTTVRKGKNKRTVTRVISNKVNRYFNTFHSLFSFYGLKIFKVSFFPVLKAYVDSKFEGKDHPMIWKLMIFDIICAFWKTSKNYFKQDTELYESCLTFLYKLYDSKASNEIKGLFRDSLVDGFAYRDSATFDSFIMKMINEIPNKSTSKSEKTLELLNNFILTWRWRFVPYLEVLVDRLLDCDPSELKVSASYSDEIPNCMRLMMNKNSTEIIVILVGYIHLIYKVSPDGHHERVFRICKYIKSVVEEMKTCSVQIVENVMHSIVSFFVNLYKFQKFEQLEFEFITCGVDLSFIAEERALKPESINMCINLAYILFERLQEFETRVKIQDYVLTFMSHENWRIRENAMFVFHCCSLYQIRDVNDDHRNIELAIKYSFDDNIYVVKRWRNLLAKSLMKRPYMVEEIIKHHKHKAIECERNIKLIRAGKAETSEVVRIFYSLDSVSIRENQANYSRAEFSSIYSFG